MMAPIAAICNRKTKDTNSFQISVRAVGTLDRLIRLITMKGLIFGPCVFDPFITLGNRTPFILNLYLFGTVLLSVPLHRYAIAYIQLIEDKHCT